MRARNSVKFSCIFKRTCVRVTGMPECLAKAASTPRADSRNRSSRLLEASAGAASATTAGETLGEYTAFLVGFNGVVTVPPPNEGGESPSRA